MRYSTFLRTLTKCPFCEDIKPRILIENDGAFLTYSLAPYHKYHLLVIPKRHVENIKDLTWDENVCIMALIVAGIKTLGNIGHNDCTIVARDGQALGRSVKHHLHYHIIPGGQIGDISLNKKVRKLLSDEEEKSLKQELEKSLNH
jgi:diadenosine tetraphosphate (Ap4A) HIT family hydrolase